MPPRCFAIYSIFYISNQIFSLYIYRNTYEGGTSLTNKCFPLPSHCDGSFWRVNPFYVAPTPDSSLGAVALGRWQCQFRLLLITCHFREPRTVQYENRTCTR
ncbi:uncharacterized protein YALI1_E05496g [Yarrowia lipolytica]|uniref:Uncharacterized protein n=1 Tax=Yarrowia lipolytica TaxID=4952 RepID=A0A1D8NH45_YARLL|nr:hypothetical protein YALI1_E05496g [Yarrowia lipolytica]